MKSWVHNEKLIINSQILSEIQIAKYRHVDVNVQMFPNTPHVWWEKLPDPKNALNFSIVTKLRVYNSLGLWLFII